ncbi:hypothetical protein D1631_18375 [Chryseobacterium nematophagum]|uniref:Uncharacterized protein n=1 Tax=Chryseobacterium nematophagum TaxID=2305228 RepID=A0A3M7TB46_9FLAO|nr:hypothetical protein [Chryseobacterium nematophagum]RNA60461.1 hypothetical protein D1631_18375 [Chryseobacterium nematophagum]
MKKIILLCVLSAFLLNCKKNTETPSTLNETDSTSHSEAIIGTLVPKSFCYMGITGKDTVYASIDDNLGTITGKLVYKNFEKDSNKGEVVGVKSGDTLKLTYEFESEGSKSKRDIYFLQKEKTLTEGIGEHTEENMQIKYAHENKISYKDGDQLQIVDCHKIIKFLK